ncbi:MAG: hypothetical protein ACM3WV_06360 [Bacillota bacterium]
MVRSEERKYKDNLAVQWAAQAKFIADTTGGEIKAASIEGQGAVFTCRWPVTEQLNP